MMDHTQGMIRILLPSFLWQISLKSSQRSQQVIHVISHKISVQLKNSGQSTVFSKVRATHSFLLNGEICAELRYELHSIRCLHVESKRSELTRLPFILRENSFVLSLARSMRILSTNLTLISRLLYSIVLNLNAQTDKIREPGFLTVYWESISTHYIYFQQLIKSLTIPLFPISK